MRSPSSRQDVGEAARLGQTEMLRPLGLAGWAQAETLAPLVPRVEAGPTSLKAQPLAAAPEVRS